MTTPLTPRIRPRRMPARISGSAAQTMICVKRLPATGAVAARHLDQRRRDHADAGAGIEHDDPDREQEDRDDDRRLAEAEEDHQHRHQRRERRADERY